MFGGLGGGGPAAVALFEAGFEDGDEGEFGDGGEPAQGGECGLGAVGPRGQFPCEVPYQVVRGVTAERGLLQEGHVDQPVQGGLGTARVGAGEAGDQRGAVGGQVEGADVAQGEGGVAVGCPVGGGEGVMGDGEGAPDAQVVVFQVLQPALRGGELTGKHVGGEGAARGQPGGDHP